MLYEMDTYKSRAVIQKIFGLKTKSGMQQVIIFLEKG